MSMIRFDSIRFNKSACIYKIVQTFLIFQSYELNQRREILKIKFKISTIMSQGK